MGVHFSKKIFVNCLNIYNYTKVYKNLLLIIFSPLILTLGCNSKDIAKLEDEIKEGSLNEFVVTATFLAGLLAALPKLIELLGQLIKGIGSFISNKLGFKKSGDAMQKFAEKLMHAGHELHDYYIGAIKTALSFMIPDWKTLPAESQKKIAELVYLVIVLSLGVISGVGAFDSLQHAHFVHAGVEGALAAVKAGEVGAFLTNAIANTIA